MSNTNDEKEIHELSLAGIQLKVWAEKGTVMQQGMLDSSAEIISFGNTKNGRLQANIYIDGMLKMAEIRKKNKLKLSPEDKIESFNSQEEIETFFKQHPTATLISKHQQNEINKWVIVYKVSQEQKVS